jgi:hypothetical protein
MKSCLHEGARSCLVLDAARLDAGSGLGSGLRPHFGSYGRDRSNVHRCGSNSFIKRFDTRLGRSPTPLINHERVHELSPHRKLDPAARSVGHSLKHRSRGRHREATPGRVDTYWEGHRFIGGARDYVALVGPWVAVSGRGPICWSLTMHMPCRFARQRLADLPENATFA